MIPLCGEIALAKGNLIGNNLENHVLLVKIEGPVTGISSIIIDPLSKG